MSNRVRCLCVWSVLLFFLSSLFSPDDAFSFDTDTLKTTGIIMGITFGVALVVVLVVGTIRDLRGRPDDDEEDDDVWSQHPVLKTLGYRPVHFRLFGEALSPFEDLFEEERVGDMEIEAFLQGKVEAIGFGSPCDRFLWDPCPATFGIMPGGLAFSNPARARMKTTPTFSIWRADERS